MRGEREKLNRYKKTMYDHHKTDKSMYSTVKDESQIQCI